ncbi:hypothetical protein LINGRAHAP2_LOCUS8448 [Linum grandiflorum]
MFMQVRTQTLSQHLRLVRTMHLHLVRIVHHHHLYLVQMILNQHQLLLIRIQTLRLRLPTRTLHQHLQNQTLHQHPQTRTRHQLLALQMGNAPLIHSSWVYVVMCLAICSTSGSGAHQSSPVVACSMDLLISMLLYAFALPSKPTFSASTSTSRFLSACFSMHATKMLHPASSAPNLHTRDVLQTKIMKYFLF